ncbi:hypothetical protein DAI22_12g082700 [Oryza sativa Japonica Group]|nr:hypothetical protein DAI22_12g082700 [Oryza sativa Japonica Group]
MVHRAAADGARRRLRRQLSMPGSGRPQQQTKEASAALVRLPCNKGKASRFKRSCFSEEDDAASAAMLLLAILQRVYCRSMTSPEVSVEHPQDCSNQSEEWDTEEDCCF